MTLLPAFSRQIEEAIEHIGVERVGLQTSGGRDGLDGPVAGANR